MTQLDETTEKLWNEETYRVYQQNSMLSWEACEMIAWNRIMKQVKDEDYNRQVS